MLMSNCLIDPGWLFLSLKALKLFLFKSAFSTHSYYWQASPTFSGLYSTVSWEGVCDILSQCFVASFQGITRVMASYSFALVVLLGEVWKHTLKWTSTRSFFS